MRETVPLRAGLGALDLVSLVQPVVFHELPRIEIGAFSDFGKHVFI